jgi:hypothetical protein
MAHLFNNTRSVITFFVIFALLGLGCGEVTPSKLKGSLYFSVTQSYSSEGGGKQALQFSGVFQNIEQLEQIQTDRSTPSLSRDEYSPDYLFYEEKSGCIYQVAQFDHSKNEIETSVSYTQPDTYDLGTLELNVAGHPIEVQAEVYELKDEDKVYHQYSARPEFSNFPYQSNLALRVPSFENEQYTIPSGQIAFRAPPELELDYDYSYPLSSWRDLLKLSFRADNIFNDQNPWQIQITKTYYEGGISRTQSVKCRSSYTTGSLSQIISPVLFDQVFDGSEELEVSMTGYQVKKSLILGDLDLSISSSSSNLYSFLLNEVKKEDVKKEPIVADVEIN